MDVVRGLCAVMLLTKENEMKWEIIQLLCRLLLTWFPMVLRPGPYCSKHR